MGARLRCERIPVVDRDPSCATGGAERTRRDGAHHEPWPITVDVVQADDWSSFFSTYLDAALSRVVGDSDEARCDRAVAAHVPHLMADWPRRRSGRELAFPTTGPSPCEPLDRAPSVPWSLAAPDGTHYVSFAEWTCPVNCIEPPLCPELGTPRTWSLTRRLTDYAAAETARLGRRTLPLLLHCRHRAYGVGMFDTAAVTRAASQAAAAIALGPVDLLIGHRVALSWGASGGSRSAERSRA